MILSVSKECQQLDQLESLRAPSCKEANERNRLTAAREALAYYETSYLASWFISRGSVDALKLRICALDYRMSEEPLAPAVDTLKTTDAWLLTAANKWNEEEIYRREIVKLKEKDKFGYAFEQKVIDLNPQELNQLREVLRYPKLVELLKNNPHLLKNFFKWALHNNLSVPVFVQFPALCKRIDLLKGRIGEKEEGKYQGGEELTYIPGTTKDVKLLINTGTAKSPQSDAVSLLEGNRSVVFKEGLELTINQIIKVFADKNYREGPLTFYKGIGVTNWNASKLGPLGKNEKDIVLKYSNPEDLIKNMRLQEEGITFQGMQNLLNNEFQEEGETFGKDSIVLELDISRSTEKLTEEGAHPCMKLFVPRDDGENVVWDKTYAFGKFGAKYPETVWQKLSMLCDNVDGVVLNPDPNGAGYTQRQRGKIYFVLTKEKGDEFLQSICRDIKRARDLELGYNKFVFQIFYNNCTKWVAKKLEHYVDPKNRIYFNHKFLELNPESGLLRLLLKSGQVAQETFFFKYVYLGYGFLLGTWRKRIGYTEKLLEEKKKHCSLNYRAPWIVHPKHKEDGYNFYHPGVPLKRLVRPYVKKAAIVA